MTARWPWGGVLVAPGAIGGGGGGGGGVELSDVTAAIATARAADVTPGAGLPCSIAPTNYSPSSSARTAALTLHSSLSVVTGRRYRLSGTVTMRDQRDGSILVTRAISGCEVVRLASSPWWTVVADGVFVPETDAVTISDWIADPSHYPCFGWVDGSGALAIAFRVRSDAPAQVTLAFRGQVADLGSSL